MKNTAISGLVLLLFFSGAILAQNGQKKLTLEEVIQGNAFAQASVRGLRSMNDGVHYTSLQNGNKIIQYDYETGSVKDTLFSLADFPDADMKAISDYAFSDDENRILLWTEREPIYRYSFKAGYFVYDRSARHLRTLSLKGKQQLATFSPDSRYVAFFRDNNLFISDLEREQELQITTDGEKNSVINGAPDWVYEEEFSFSRAFDWSADGQSLAYIRFDESHVKEFNMTVYKGLKPEIPGNELYPENRSWKYPKAGEDNSVVSVLIYDLGTGTTTTINTGQETDIYIPRIRWTNDPDRLCIFRLNRLQNKLELILADRRTGRTQVVYSDENPWYIDEANFDRLTFLSGNKQFLMLNEQSGWNHIYRYDLMKGEVINPITSGNYDVTDFYGVDEVNGLVYFQAAKESPLRREVYMAGLDGSGLKKLSVTDGVNRAAFSRGFRYFINSHTSSGSPLTVTLHTADGERIRVIEDNKVLTDRLAGYSFRYREYFTFTTRDGVNLNGWMIRPPDFDPKKKYPVLMVQYSGPGSQEVLDEWDFGWHQYLAQEGIIITCVDGRGTGCRGEAFGKMTYLQLGKYETLDQVEAAKYLGTLPYVDPSRIGIWGWSYGGFITLSCLTQGEPVFKAGIAVAPVSNWKYYDNIYTERFMRKPQDNPQGYDENAPASRAEKLSGNLLIIHGTADDNVHVQNTLEFCEALVQAGKTFDMMLYTNRNHGIYGGNTRHHLYRKMTQFLEENL